MLEELKRQVYEANLALERAGLVILTWGNVSGFDADSGLVAIKPSGVGYEDLRPEQMVIVDLEGKLVEGNLRPSSDTPTHLELYRSFAGIGGVAHTHSTYATAWAQARRALPCFGTTHADYFRGEVPVTEEMTPEEIGGEYELETGKVIVRAFMVGQASRLSGTDGRDARPADYHQVPAVLVASHGPFTWGPTPEKAVENSIVLEHSAMLGAIAEGLSPGLPCISCHLQDKHFLRKHGKDAYYGQK